MPRNDRVIDRRHRWLRRKCRQRELSALKAGSIYQVLRLTVEIELVKIAVDFYRKRVNRRAPKYSLYRGLRAPIVEKRYARQTFCRLVHRRRPRSRGRRWSNGERGVELHCIGI